jgi:hypothetical protein
MVGDDTFSQQKKATFHKPSKLFSEQQQQRRKKKEVEELVYQMALEPLRSHQSEQAKLLANNK